MTRSMLGWGVVAGPFYLIAAVVHAALKDGFDFSHHALSLLMLSDTGWIQTTNLVLVALMTITAGIGFARSVAPVRRARTLAILIGVYGVGMLGSAVFPPDPMNGFPPNAASEEVTISGVMHLAFGAAGFVSLAAGAFVFASWARSRRSRKAHALSIAAGLVVIVCFASGGALSVGTSGIVLLWIAVLTIWAWLLAASIYAYRTVPHPDPQQR